MHPILGHGGRLLVYLALWLPGALLLAAVVALTGEDIGWVEALLLTLPLSLFYAFICLAAWYPSQALRFSRVNPVSGAMLGRMVGTHLGSAMLSSGLWQIVWAYG